MKKVILLLVFMPVMAYGQIVVNFENGDCTDWIQSSPGRWASDTTGAISGNFSLHHVFDNPDAGADQAGLPLDKLHPPEGKVVWTFSVRHGYDPSSSNNWVVFLMSDTDPLQLFNGGYTNGFAIGVNLTGYDDTLRLMKIRGSSAETVVNCRINWQTAIGPDSGAAIRVEREPAGRWTVTVSYLDGSIISSSSGSESDLFPCRWFSIFYRYSSSRDRLLWFDDLRIEGVFYEDNKVPSLISCVASGRNSLIITLSDQPSDKFASPANIRLLPGNITPESVIKEGSASYIIKFKEELINRSACSLLITSICNQTGFCSNDVEVSFVPAWPERGDVLISEIMADPDPPVSLPREEYLEITNRTGFSFFIRNWKIWADDDTYSLSGFTVSPHEVRILCAAHDTSLFRKFGTTTGLKQFPYLTDAGKRLALVDDCGQLIHGIEYSDGWYRNELKSGGGWSLEIIDPSYPFYYDENWISAVSLKGGTPGSPNSVDDFNPDSRFEGELSLFMDDSVTLSVRSPEPLFGFADLKDKISVDGKNPEKIISSDILCRDFSVSLSGPLKEGKVYTFTSDAQIKDFAGNNLEKETYSFGIASTSVKGDILFNELLFNPLPGHPDFIEFYNASDKIIDASRLIIVAVNDDTKDTSQIYLLSEERRCILPGEYFAVTADKNGVNEDFISSDPVHIHKVGSLPTMSDDKGHLILYNRELVKIDEVSYNENMHSVLLSGYEGISLEKIDPEGNSMLITNWHSASEACGWGTPGAENSVNMENHPSEDKVTLSSSRITPGIDGNDDFLVIDLQLTGISNVVSVSVFDEWGTPVKRVAENLLAGAEASLTWDGTADDGSPADTGIYIVLITLFDESGKTGKWKKVCTLIRE